MQIISHVEVKKFRSLKELKKMDLTDLNIFVGQNDNGKSNLLRALNLFFNGETDLGEKFRFLSDYCYHSSTGKGTIREVKITLTIEPPKRRFKNADSVKWSKQWKEDGSVKEERKYSKTGKTVPSTDNVNKWLDKIRYRYVPAIKGKEYFSYLMGELYDVLSEAHGRVLATNGEGFIGGIQEVTKSITKDLKDQIDISNTIQVPSDFRLLFSNLDFGATVGEYTYHLKQRGDGIKIRHIPIILKYMADQEANIVRAGFVKPDTIWGFEEPENNLELKYAYDLASTIQEYSKKIQILLTTHSPAFYSLDNDPRVSSFYVSKFDDGCTKIEKISGDDRDLVHEKMGLLPLITPYLTELNKQQDRIKVLEEDLDRLKITTKCVVLVEDENSDLVKKFFEINGFKKSETEYFSYSGCGKINSAILLGQYLKHKDSNLNIIIHRDRDYLSQEEVSELKKKVEKSGCSLYVTKGVDIESEFYNLDHVCSLFPSIAKESISNMFEEVNEESRTDSLNKFIDYSLSNPKVEKNAYSKRISEVTLIFESDENRYRHGKTAIKKLKQKVQRIIKTNPDFYKKSEFVINSELMKIANKIW